MKIPRLKLRKKTRATLSGLLIAIGSLYALAAAYDEARDNLWRFFISSVVLLGLIMLAAIALVALWSAVRWLWRRILTRATDENDDGTQV